MNNTNTKFQEDARFRILRLIEDDGNMTQRQIADKLGLSVGAVNYCIKGLAEKGAIKVRNFRTSNAKWRYVYVLTPSGVSERASLTGQYLRRRMREYEVLRSEIDSLVKENPDNN